MRRERESEKESTKKLSLLADTHRAKRESMLIMLNKELRKKKETTITFVKQLGNKGKRKKTVRIYDKNATARTRIHSSVIQ